MAQRRADRHRVILETTLEVLLSPERGVTEGAAGGAASFVFWNVE